MFLDSLGPYADLIGIIATLASLYTAVKVRHFQKHEKERLDQKIQIRLVNKDDKGVVQSYIDIPGKMRREDMNRGEVLGWIGMLPMEKPGDRYTIESLSTKAFLEKMNEIQAAYGDRLFEIDCKPDELIQFKIKPNTPGQAESEIAQIPTVG